MKCMDCPLKYIGKMGQTFYIRYKEYVQAITNNKGNSVYSNHVLSTGLTYGSITKTMNIIKTEKKGKHLNTLEKYHIHKSVKTDYT
jgi:hypothetical protein